MPSERTHHALLDIRDNILFAAEWSNGLSEREFEENRMIFYAVTRCLEIISEASRRLSVDLTERHPQIAWRDMRDAGNIYRHAYDGVQERFILTTVRQSLPELLAIVQAELSRP
jgi:uncharacterized protein with HEPN domain